MCRNGHGYQLAKYLWSYICTNATISNEKFLVSGMSWLVAHYPLLSLALLYSMEHDSAYGLLTILHVTYILVVLLS